MGSSNVSLLLGKPSEPPKLKDALMSFLSSNACREAQCAFAYVSVAGLADSVHSIFAKECQSLRKRWVVGIHNGITEPAALESLVDHPNSQVRVYSPTGKINRAALYGDEKLHSKAFFLNGDAASLLIVGSANLTRSAIGIHASNYEAGAAILTGDDALRNRFNRWFTCIWKESLPVSVRIVDRYSQLRERFLKEHKVILPRLDEVPDNAMGTRQHFWIEAGAMSGGDRNQIEFGPSLAAFFGNLVRGTVRVRVQWQGVTRDDRPLSYKITQWNTEIWRLSLTTSRQGGPAYPNQIIHFTRAQDENGELYTLDVAPSNSAKARSWRRQANRLGTLAMTGLGVGTVREYGVY